MPTSGGDGIHARLNFMLYLIPSLNGITKGGQTFIGTSCAGSELIDAAPEVRPYAR